jgi:hypothetical protein
LEIDAKYSHEPTIVELNDIKIKKISCGSYHSLLLSFDGDIYAFGENKCGEVGNGTIIQQSVPIKLQLKNKFIAIASHPYYSISMSKSEQFFYVWGDCKQIDSSNREYILEPKSANFKSFDDILNFHCNNQLIFYCKSYGKLKEFEDSFIRNGYYFKTFEEIKFLGSGSFGKVFEAKNREQKNHYGVKKMEFKLNDKNETIKEYLNFTIIKKIHRLEDNEYLVKHFDAWFEESVSSNLSGISFYILMELCDKTLKHVINEIDKNLNLKKKGVLTIIGFYIASRIFIEILEGVNYLHKQNPHLIHRDLNPGNILLKKCDSKGFRVKIADFGLMAIHKFSEQSHTLDKGAPIIQAPEVIASKTYDTKADVYSLGIIFNMLFDCFTLRLTQI